MAFTPLSTSNTFSQWITEKQRAVSVINDIIDGDNTSIFYANTNISVGGDLSVGGDATLNTLNVFDTFSVINIDVTDNLSGFTNLSVPNLTIAENVETLNITSDLFVGTDVTVHGDLLSFLCCQNELNLSGDLSANLVIIDTATINTLIGTANTNIYNNIFSSNAFTSVQNTLSEFASLSCILG